MTSTLATLQVFALRASLNREYVRADDLERVKRRYEALLVRAHHAVRLAIADGPSPIAVARRQVLEDLELELSTAIAVGPPPLLPGEGGRL